MSLNIRAPDNQSIVKKNATPPNKAQKTPFIDRAEGNHGTDKTDKLAGALAKMIEDLQKIGKEYPASDGNLRTSGPSIVRMA